MDRYCDGRVGWRWAQRLPQHRGPVRSDFRYVDGDRARAAFGTERATVEAELARLAHERSHEARALDAPLLGKYEQLLKQRRGVAVARLSGGEVCAACHVRLRPHVAQLVRRNDAVVPCDSCQRILYFEPPIPGVSSSS